VFGLDSAALLRRADGHWVVEAADGDDVPATPDGADLVERLSADTALVLRGGTVAADDQVVLNAFAAQLATLLEHGRLRVEAERAGELADADALRTALLQAVSHDLRTPLAAIKASATSLRQPDVTWSDDDVAEFLRTIDEETDRLVRLVENLLDMSRVNAGVVSPRLERVALEDIVPAALASLGPRAAAVDVRLSETLPPVLADAALLERVLANVVDNAVRASPPDARVRVEAAELRDRLEVRVVDRGPGIPRAARDDVFQPFQRLGDRDAGTGVGLGLAVARGFADAMGALLELDDTPGGGTTVSVSLPRAP
jgi:two-component system sensor histidine kinase KdpD